LPKDSERTAKVKVLQDALTFVGRREQEGVPIYLEKPNRWVYGAFSRIYGTIMET
jgi:hypothetical protein